MSHCRSFSSPTLFSLIHTSHFLKHLEGFSFYNLLMWPKTRRLSVFSCKLHSAVFGMIVFHFIVNILILSMYFNVSAAEMHFFFIICFEVCLTVSDAAFENCNAKVQRFAGGSWIWGTVVTECILCETVKSESQFAPHKLLLCCLCKEF